MTNQFYLQVIFKRRNDTHFFETERDVFEWNISKKKLNQNWYRYNKFALLYTKKSTLEKKISIT